jgi:hypothetical protein
MSQIVVDTGLASYIFNWHSLAQRYRPARHEQPARLRSRSETPAALTLMAAAR